MIPGADGIVDMGGPIGGMKPYVSIVGGAGAQDNYPLIEPYSSTLISLPPIRINSNADFDEAHGIVNWDTGDGSAVNPWIIQNYDIDGTGEGSCIYIGNTTDHCEVRDCNLYEASGNPAIYYWNTGLVLFNVQNSKVTNISVFLHDGHGIYLYSSSNNNGHVG